MTTERDRSIDEVRPPALRLADVHVRPDGADREVLGGIDLEVDAGDVVAVLGSSGSGKSTMLRAIVGLVPVSKGSVHLHGQDLDGVPTHRRGVGLMFQDHALFPHLDVAGNVGFGPRMAGVDRSVRRTRVAELLELVGLGGFERRSVASLSGGERQRVALARTLAPEPRLVLLDEPMGSLDRALREDLVMELGAILRSTGTTTLVVTHDHAEATTIADRLVILDHGRIVQQGAVAEVLARPNDDHVARLLGSVHPDGGG